MSTFGLALIVAAWVALGGLLIDDGHRALRGEMTFSQWAAKKRYRMWLFVAGMAAFPVGMFLHLWF